MSFIAVPDDNKELHEAIVARLADAGEHSRAVMIDLLWKFVIGDNHGVMDCAADMREHAL